MEFRAYAAPLEWLHCALFAFGGGQRSKSFPLCGCRDSQSAHDVYMECISMIAVATYTDGCTSRRRLRKLVDTSEYLSPSLCHYRSVRRRSYASTASRVSRSGVAACCTRHGVCFWPSSRVWFWRLGSKQRTEAFGGTRHRQSTKPDNVESRRQARKLHAQHTEKVLSRHESNFFS